jgi:hypothetical protein
MFHQSDVIPRAGPLAGASAFCFDPHPAAVKTLPSASAAGATRLARGNLSPDLPRCQIGYPGKTA